MYPTFECTREGKVQFVLQACELSTVAKFRDVPYHPVKRWTRDTGLVYTVLLKVINGTYKAPKDAMSD